MAFGDTWSGPKHGEEFWDWMDAQRAPSELRKAMLGYAQQADRLVEIGCGAGHFLEQLALSGWSGHYRGYDFSPEALDVAGRRLIDNNVYGEVILGNFMTKRVAKADLVVACGVLQHQPEWLPMVKRCLEVAPRVAFGIGYTTTAYRNRVKHHDGHSDWYFSVPHTLRLLAGEGISVVESRLTPNPLRRHRHGRMEWLLVLGV